MLRLLIDENVDHRILRGLLRRVPQLDFVVVAQIGLAGTPDIDLLRWAAQEIEQSLLTITSGYARPDSASSTMKNLIYTNAGGSTNCPRCGPE